MAGRRHLVEVPTDRPEPGPKFVIEHHQERHSAPRPGNRLSLILGLANLGLLLVLIGLFSWGWLGARDKGRPSAVEPLAPKVAILASAVKDLRAEVAELSAKTEDFLSFVAHRQASQEAQPYTQSPSKERAYLKGRILHVAKLNSRLKPRPDRQVPQIAINTAFTWPDESQQNLRSLIGSQLLLKAGPQAEPVRVTVVELIRNPKRKNLVGHVNRAAYEKLGLDGAGRGRATCWVALDSTS